MKVSPKARAAAVEALRCEADDNFARRWDYSTEEDKDVDAYLVAAAMDAVWDALGYSSDLEVKMLEAAALLENGWSPGDPVERLS